MEDSKRKLIWHGMFLFLLGLLTGFVETKFTNQRMALAAHLEGVMNGTFLVALGAAWGIAALSPITGAGHHALAWQETVITAASMSVGLAIVGASVLVLWGLRRRATA